MRINNQFQSNITFRQKYPISQLISCACDKPFLRKSDQINTINSINKLRKQELKDIRTQEKAFNEFLEKTRIYILEKLPELKPFIKHINTMPEEFHQTILEIAEIRLGKELELKHRIRPRSLTKKTAQN